jgi:hypothetical protein
MDESWPSQPDPFVKVLLLNTAALGSKFQCDNLEGQVQDTADGNPGDYHSLTIELTHVSDN